MMSEAHHKSQTPFHRDFLRAIVHMPVPHSPLFDSPAKRRYNLLSGSMNMTARPPNYRQNLFPAHSSTPSLILASKEQSATDLVPAMLFSMNEPFGTGNTDSPTVPALIPSHSAPDIQSQRALLDRESHKNRLSLENQIKSEKKTASTYGQKLKRYEEWWRQDQAQRASEASQSGSVWIIEDPHPITVLKTAIYLAYDTTRQKV